MAARTLNALGYMSGASSRLNDRAKVKEMEVSLKCAISFEQMRHREKEGALHRQKEKSKQSAEATARKEEKQKKKQLQYEQICNPKPEPYIAIFLFPKYHLVHSAFVCDIQSSIRLILPPFSFQFV